MSISIEAWDLQESPDDDIKMFIVEIRGGAHAGGEIVDALDQAFHRFGEVNTIKYHRTSDIAGQKRLVESLGIDWNPANLPMLLVLENKPSRVTKDDRALQFELGGLTHGSQVREITSVLIEASQDEDFMKTLTWEKRKKRMLEKLPAFKEGASLAISVAGLGV